MVDQRKLRCGHLYWRNAAVSGVGQRNDTLSHIQGPTLRSRVIYSELKFAFPGKITVRAYDFRHHLHLDYREGLVLLLSRKGTLKEVVAVNARRIGRSRNHREHSIPRRKAENHKSKGILQPILCVHLTSATTNSIHQD
jgi:hypothetical protein